MQFASAADPGTVWTALTRAMMPPPTTADSPTTTVESRVPLLSLSILQAASSAVAGVRVHDVVDSPQQQTLSSPMIPSSPRYTPMMVANSPSLTPPTSLHQHQLPRSTAAPTTTQHPPQQQQQSGRPRSSPAISEENRLLAGVVSGVLMHQITLNESLGMRSVPSPFDCASDRRAAISLHDYIERVLRYTPATCEVYLLSLAYLDTLLARNTTLALTKHNVHRLWITSFVVASKFADDEFLSNTTYSKVAGISLGELNLLERWFLTLGLGFSLCLSNRAFSMYSKPVDSLIGAGHFLGAIDQCFHTAICSIRSSLGLSPEEFNVPSRSITPPPTTTVPSAPIPVRATAVSVIHANDSNIAVPVSPTPVMQ